MTDINTNILLVDSSFLSQLFLFFHAKSENSIAHSLTPTESKFVCVCERERQRETERDRERQRETERDRERERMRVGE